MLDWNPALYRFFEEERTRPARELLARVPHPAPTHVVDLGCGPGNSTELLVQRYPQARVAGLDYSEAMLASARERLPSVDFVAGDIAHWVPDMAPDLIYANASLQWLSGHATLFPRLFRSLAPGGVLAVQMPNNWQEPAHVLMREVAAQAPWREALAAHAPTRVPIATMDEYYDWLIPFASDVDVWQTVYQHVMDSPAAIVQWLRSTGLKPFVDPLPDFWAESFLLEYERRLNGAYPLRADGKRLLAFPRLFLVARRRP